LIEGYFLSLSSGRAVTFIFAVFHAAVMVDQIANGRIRGFLCYFAQHLAITAYFLRNCVVYGKKVDGLAFDRWNLLLN
jgi:hypothetical protein